MGVSLSIKNVPDDWVERLRQRADRHHRSLQGELMSILEATLESERRRTVEGLLDEVRSLGISTPSEAAEMIRADRDGR
jgi:plasmid stability protein